MEYTSLVPVHTVRYHISIIRRTSNPICNRTARLKIAKVAVRQMYRACIVVVDKSIGYARECFYFLFLLSFNLRPPERNNISETSNADVTQWT